jgi:ornithine cyclodeaminase
VLQAYQAHARGRTALPYSTFLPIPDDPSSRIIALPAYLGGEEAVAGLKWVASFPGNRARGLERASAVVILNSARTGRPTAILEGSRISAGRTAASAALAARHLRGGRMPACVGLIGCGVINLEVCRFLLALCPEVRTFLVYDTDPHQASRFAGRLGPAAGVTVRLAPDPAGVLAAAPVVSLATTALQPHIPDLSCCPPGALLLHLSLRDLAPEAILRCDNVVDDVDHVCRAGTSVHLAERLVGHRGFIRCTLGDVLLDRSPPQASGISLQVFSPFGLGILDLAVARLVCDLARCHQVGTWVDGFFC